VRSPRVTAGLLGVALAATGLVARADDEPEAKVLYADQRVRQVPQPDTTVGYEQPDLYPTLAWAALQLVPSPELAFGRHRRIDPSGRAESDPAPAFGLRWEVTPLLWSFGVHPRQSRWRALIVDPIARQSGSLELSAAIEYIGGHVDKVIPRSTLRVYLPVAQKGEYVSMSLGTTAYDLDGLRLGYEVGAYLLAGVVGAQVTVAPAHAPLAALTTLRLRFF
jgi:hypothetical protein